MPEMQLYYPHEWEYVLFLMKLHNLNGNSDFILQKKKENEKLLKKMQGMLLVEKYEDDEKDSMKQINLEKESAQEDDKELLEKEILKMNKEKEEGRRISNELFVIELNQKQLEMEKQKKIEKERKDKERKKIVKYWICIKLNKLWVFFFQSFCFIQTRNEDDDEDENKENEADFHYAVDTLIAISNKKRSYSHLESPPWPDLVHLMVSFFPEAEEEYIKKKIREESLELQKNITNFMAILSKVLF